MKIIEISAGRERSVALAADGDAFGWGSVKVLGATLPPGYPGELCVANPTEIGHNRYAQPTPHRLNPGLPFSAIADGTIDTVGVRTGGAVLSCRPVVSPERGAERAPIAGLPPAARQVVLTESGGFARYADGRVWSWGMRAGGQLGRAAGALFADAAAVPGLAAIAQLAAGHGHVLALDRAGQVWSWGANSAGQLGHGDLAESSTPRRIALPSRIRRVAAGDTHSFAVDDAGRLWAWGSNNFGQLGPIDDGAAKYLTRPARSRTGFGVAQVDAGMFYSVAASAHGDVFAWGWNGTGQLAQEGVGASARPLRVKGLAHVTRLAAGVGHALALCDAGVFAWGNNRSSACGGFPSVAVQVAPARVAFA